MPLLFVIKIILHRYTHKFILYQLYCSVVLVKKNNFGFSFGFGFGKFTNYEYVTRSEKTIHLLKQLKIE